MVEICDFDWNFDSYLLATSINIISDPMFHNADKVFGAKCAELKRQGLAKVEQKQPICQEDFQKLYECGLFDTSSPVIPQKNLF